MIWFCFLFLRRCVCVQADEATDEVYARLALVAEDKVSVGLQSSTGDVGCYGICSIDFFPCSPICSLHFARAMQLDR